MRQHLIKSTGAPTIVPEFHSQLYLDVSTGEHYLSTGNFTVDDWFGPLITGAAIEQALSDFAAGIGNVNRSSVTHVDVITNAEYGRHAMLNLSNRDGRFFIITDDAQSDFDYDLRIDKTVMLDLGTEFTVYNYTTAEIDIRDSEDVFLYSGKPGRVVIIRPGYVFKLKFIGINSTTRQWLVMVADDSNANTLEGQSLTEVKDYTLTEVDAVLDLRYTTMKDLFDGILAEEVPE